MGGLAGAWLVGAGIVAWREARQSGHMPVPAALLGVTGLFAALTLISEIAPASRPVTVLIGWGLDVAGLLSPRMAPLYGQVQQAQATEAAAAGATGQPAQNVSVA